MKRLVLLLGVLLFQSAAFAQQPAQPVQRDPQGVAALQRALSAMGDSLPSDSVATGTIVVTAGSTTENGIIRILSRGLDQLAEQSTAGPFSARLVYSRGRASLTSQAGSKPLPLEQVVGSDVGVFPAFFIARALADPSATIQYVSREGLNGAPADRLQVWRRFTDTRLAHLEEFSRKEVWLDVSTGLPRKISWTFHDSLNGPSVPVELTFSDYRSIGGALFPFAIDRSVNGVPYAAIRIDAVLLNTGLTDDDFAFPPRRTP